MSEPAVQSPPKTLTLSLISHTNAGKTTLARTLLREDIGEVADRAHVTQLAEIHVLLETSHGDSLQLADTPGFGDSVRLVRRLRRSGNPIGWLLFQVWDRFTDRAFWGAQQALRNGRDAADIVLYVVNSSEDPASAGYVTPEMEILGWIGKPVIVLLNQLGPPRVRELDVRDEALWRAHVGHYAWVRDVLPFDAFARCWVQEDALLRAVERCVDEPRRVAFSRIRQAWCTRNYRTFSSSVEVLADLLVQTAIDRESLANQSWREKTRAFVKSVASGLDSGQPDDAEAVSRLAERLDARLRCTTDTLIRLHGLSGKAVVEVLARMQGQVNVARPIEVGRAGLLGGLASGALGGLAADLGAGGLTLGAGALIGALVGALGSSGAAKALNTARRLEKGVARWSVDFLRARVESAVLRYLAVAHFGRGRGHYVESEYPSHWRPFAAEEMECYKDALDEVWTDVEQDAAPEDIRNALGPILSGMLAETLIRLYPEAGPLFSHAESHGATAQSYMRNT